MSSYDLKPFLMMPRAERTLEDHLNAITACGDITNSASLEFFHNGKTPDPAITGKLNDAWASLYDARKMIKALMEAEKVA